MKLIRACFLLLAILVPASWTIAHAAGDEGAAGGSSGKSSKKKSSKKKSESSGESGDKGGTKE